MPTLTLNQESIFYAHHTSSPARHNILLLHGAGGSHLVWPAALRRLPDATVYALDLPGHGRSTGTGYAQISEYAAVVSQFIEALKLTDVVLVGHSMGGAVAQTLALRPPPDVAALILVGTGAKLRVAPAILAQILPDFEQAVTTINQFAWSAAAPPQMVVRGRVLLAQTPPPVLYNDFSACDQFDLRDQLAHITAPTLVIAGSEDKLTPPAYGRFLADHIPQAQFRLLADAGHMMMVEKPAETAAAIKAFLADL